MIRTPFSSSQLSAQQENHSSNMSDNNQRFLLDRCAKSKLSITPTGKVDGFSGRQIIIAAVLIPDDDGFISISSDRSIRVWLKRQSGRYWPSVCEYAPSNPTTLLYVPALRSLFVGLDDGNITGFALSEDLNAITPKLKYGGHVSFITSIVFDLHRKHLFSTGDDKRLSWSCYDTGTMVGSVLMKSATNCVCIDELSACVFVGEESGLINFFNVSEYRVNQPLKSSELSRHKAGVLKLYWDVENGRLFSCGIDKKIVVWNISTQKGKCYELVGQVDVCPIGAVLFANKDTGLNGLLSCYSNGIVVFWNLNTHREQTIAWNESDTCQRCNIHFFWHLKQMWTRKQVGVRQHHCRKCGRAVCDNCSKSCSVLPAYGFEIPVRVCVDCNSSITPTDKISLAEYANIGYALSFMDYDPSTKRLLVVDKDTTISIVELNYVDNQTVE